jgi:hypothetical protein
MGVTTMIEDKRQEVESGSISSLTDSLTTGESITSFQRSDDSRIVFNGELKMIEHRMNKAREEDATIQRDRIAKERKRTNERLDSIKEDIIGIMKMGRKEMKEEEDRKREEDEARWEKRMNEMMGVIVGLGIKKKE